MGVSLGQVVYSKAGRDAGRMFVVVDIANEQYVLIADGDLRRTDKPKKKKIKHLELSEKVIESIGYKLVNKMRVTNSEVRKALAALENRHENENEESI